MRNIKRLFPPRLGITAGFTLLELLIAIVVSSIAIAAIYTAYQVQQRQYTNQTQVVKMQQSIRSVMLFITSEIRMAGYDPRGNSGAGFVEAKGHKLHFTKDTVNASGTDKRGDNVLTGTMEDLTFTLDPTEDTDNNGIADNGSAPLQLSYKEIEDGAVVTKTARVAENISAIEFAYTMADGTVTTTPTDLTKISSVTVSILSRAQHPDTKFTNSTTYTTGNNATWGPFNDNYRRRLLVANIKCRNMGL